MVKFTALLTYLTPKTLFAIGVFPETAISGTPTPQPRQSPNLPSGYYPIPPIFKSFPNPAQSGLSYPAPFPPILPIPPIPNPNLLEIFPFDTRPGPLKLPLTERGS